MPSCPSESAFERLRDGEVEDEELVELMTHLEVCDPCRDAYEHLVNLRIERDIRELHDDVTKPIESAGDETLASAPQAGKHFPNISGYRITGVVGRGGMGIVYKAVQTKLDRTVALKVLPAIMTTASPETVSRFKREATAAARLHHTNIIPVYDFGESHDTYYYAMELVDGRALDEVLKFLATSNAAIATPTGLSALLQRTFGVSTGGQSEGFDPSAVELGEERDHSGSSSGRSRAYYQQVALWISEVAEALHYAHGQGIIHRDIKPSNLILSRDGRIMVADFGLARMGEDYSVTTTGALMGTLRYMSPEQAMAKRVRVDHRTDIYSLGATFYELMTFQPVFSGSDDKEILGLIIGREPTRPRKLVPQVPYELETICMKTLEKHPDDRYATARAFAEDLRRFMHDLPIVAKPPGVITRTIKLARRHRSVTVAVIAAVLLSITGAFSLTLWRDIRVQNVNRLISEGDGLTGAKSWQGAIKLYEKALDLDEQNPKAIANLARLYKDWYNSLEEPDPTLLERGNEICDRGLAHHPDDIRLLNNKGVFLKKAQRYDEALATYRQAVELNPSYYAAWTNMGVIRVLQDDLDTAYEELTKAAEHARNAKISEILESAEPFRNLAAFELHKGLPTALDHVQEAVKRAPLDYAGYLLEARIYIHDPQHRDPQEALNAAIVAGRHAVGDDPRLHRVRAQAELLNALYQQAIASAQRALDGGDLPAINHLTRAAAYAALGQQEDAAASLQAADSTWPAKLKDPAAYMATADKGILWIESASLWYAWRDQAVARLASPPDRP